MVFKGSVGTSGTVTTLPDAAQSNGYTYKAISDGSNYKVGDTLISNGVEWVVIPSGDDLNEIVEITKAEYDKIPDRETNGIVYLITDWDQVSNESGIVPAYKIATESKDGLMSKEDKFKLNHLIYGRKDGTIIGANSTAEGINTTASGRGSHAEGYLTVASDGYSHAEGSNTTASGVYSHAEGEHTIASGPFTHAEGYETTASNLGSHSEGTHTTASGRSSHAEGEYTIANNDYSHASGKYNANMTTDGTLDNTTGTAFVIGNGTSSSAKSNAFCVQFDGTVKAKSTLTASITADYAEFFEWLDENLSSEDRVGRFVTIAFGEGNYKQIRYANSTDNYILGITSGHPFVLGNGDCDTWNGMYTYDDFNRVITEPAPLIKRTIDEKTGKTKEIPVLDENGKQVYQGTRPVINPNYDPNKEYISRFDRPEWEPVAMMGVVSVYDDGTCEVGQYCKPSDKNGIATISDKETKFMVIRRIKDNIVEVIIK